MATAEEAHPGKQIYTVRVGYDVAAVIDGGWA
jgi:hypothetical protein